MLDDLMDLFGANHLREAPSTEDQFGLESSASPDADPDWNPIFDGNIQVQYIDLDGDGISETELAEQIFDLDGDGVADGQLVSLHSDFDLDGTPDLHIDSLMVDLDGDGTADFGEIGLDTDGDGIFDRLDQFLDVDGDGIFDVAQVSMDRDGDGQFDAVQQMEDWDGDGVFQEVVPAAQEEQSQEPPQMPGDGAAPNLEPFDPAEADSDRLVGNPEEAMENWHWQETDSSCAVASQEFVLEQLTGQEFEESDLRELAEENGWYLPQGGTPMDDVGNILEHMGLQVERSQGNSIDDIARCLQEGGQVIVAVDSSELWEGVNDDHFGPGMQADHAIQVIGIDYTDPDEPMVILNDPGVSNGGGAQVPLDEFMDAWEDSGCFMVEAYA